MLGKPDGHCGDPDVQIDVPVGGQHRFDPLQQSRIDTVQAGQRGQRGTSGVQGQAGVGRQQWIQLQPGQVRPAPGCLDQRGQPVPGPHRHTAATAGGWHARVAGCGQEPGGGVRGPGIGREIVGVTGAGQREEVFPQPVGIQRLQHRNLTTS